MIKKRLITAFLFASAIFYALLNCQKDSNGGTSVTGENLINMINNADELKKIINSQEGKLLVIDLYADWCVPCRILTPILSELALEMKDKAAFYKINLEKNPETAQIFNVTGIPLVILMKNKTAVHAIQGLAPKSEYVRAINNFSESSTGKNEAAPDGELIRGIRTIKLSPESSPGDIYVYRGEEVKLIIAETKYPYSIHIPEYKISVDGAADKKLEVQFKADKTGVFPVFCNGKCPTGDGAQFGRIIVMQFKSEVKTEYREVSAAEAKKIIDEKKPLILDVRTPNEFYSGHIKGAKLIPLQQLEERVTELSDYKNKDILVYCRSGNRSTVASEVLIKHGFKKIYNLRSGMNGWIKEGYDAVE